MSNNKYIDDIEHFNSLTQQQRMQQGYPYLWYDPELTKARRHAKILTHKYNNIDPTLLDEAEEEKLRVEIMNKLLGSVKSNRFHIESGFKCDYGFNIHLGHGILMNFGCILLDCAPIVLGNRVLLGPGVHIYTATHPVEADLRQEFGLARKVIIGDDVWIGGGAIICPGVTIGNRVTVAAGSIVTKDVPDDVLVGGNPAKIIKHLTPAIVTASTSPVVNH